MSQPLGITNYYLGIVKAVTSDDDDRLKDKEWHEVIIDIPGTIQGVIAFPFRDDLDEPKINDRVLVWDMDPLYHSYYLYKKLKEDGFIGFRSSGKMVSITPDDITIGVFGPDDNDEYPDYAEDEIPDCDPGEDGSGNGFAYIKLERSGNIDIRTKGKSTVNIAGDDGSTVTIKNDSEVTIEGASKVNIKGDSTINVDGDTKLNCKGSITITGSSQAPMKTEEVVFGKELVNQLTALQNGLNELASGVNAALTQSAPIPMDGGASLKATMIASWMPSFIKLQMPGAPGDAAKNLWAFNDTQLLNKDVKTGGTF